MKPSHGNEESIRASKDYKPAHKGTSPSLDGPLPDGDEEWEEEESQTAAGAP
jgi:hypothetical protein